MARLLVVEDFPPLASVITAVVKREGHSVVQCHSAGAALLEQEYFDHAILDIDLPDGNGVKLAVQLFEQKRVGSVVFFTATRDRDILAQASSIGLVVDKAAGCNCLVAAINQLRQPGNYRLAAVAGSPTGTTVNVANRSGTRRRFDQKR